MFPAQERQTSNNGDSPHGEDEAIIAHLKRMANRAKFCRLFDDGDISDYGGDHSAADQGLCRLIAFRTQEPEQIDRIFRLSALSRQKWEYREDYRDRTIAKAITHVRDRYQGVSAESNGQPEGEGHTPEIGDESPAEDPPEEIPIHLTDRGNALRLVKAHGNNIHYIYRWKKWLVWDGTRWVVDEGNRVEALAKKVIVGIYAEAQATISRVSKELEQGSLGEDEQKKRAKEIDVATARLKWALKSESAERLSGMLRHARSERGIAITPEELDANP
jgi:hypothetical protein